MKYYLLNIFSGLIMLNFLAACDASSSQSFEQENTIAAYLLEEDSPMDLFVQDFKEALAEDDTLKMISMFQFPVVNNICYDIETTQKVSAGGKEMTLPKSSKEKFIACYGQIFNNCIKKKLRYIRVKDLKPSGNGYEINVNIEHYTQDGMPAGAGSFTLAISEIDGEYYFTGVFCLGACEADC